MKGSVNALMKLIGFSTSNKVKKHCTKCILISGGIGTMRKRTE